MQGQTTIFDILYPKYKITKPIRLIEFFAGYGSQALALKYLGVPFEHHKICEWAVKSIQAYKDIHFSDNNIDYSKYISKEQIIDILNELGISSNYNEPMSLKQIQRIPEKQLRTIYNNIIATHNLVNIQQVKGKDLEIVDKDKYEYIVCYSFPCQDLSLAGKGKGMSDTTTRSGMLWEVERILLECHEMDQLPQVLLMENVPQVHGTDNVEDFNKWQLRLEELGYKNYFEDLIATDYGIPQTRNRCFMVSILGDYSYSFPKKQELKLKLKDMLEDNVDEKYFISDKMLNCFLSESKDSKFPRKERFLQTLDNTNNKGIAATLCTTGGTRATDNFICNKALKETLESNDIKNDISYVDSYNKKIRDDDLSSTITTRVSDSNNSFLLIKNATQTLTTMGGENNGVVVDTLKRELCNKLIEDDLVQEYDVIKHAYSKQILEGNKKCIERSDGNMVTLTTRADCVGTAVKDDIGNLRIRKLTPRECGRLMNVKDEDIDKIQLSDNAMYHIFGDSICTNVLMAIFGELLEIDWESKLKEMLYGDAN